MKAFSIKILKHGRKCDTLQEQSKVLEGAERILPRNGRNLRKVW